MTTRTPMEMSAYRMARRRAYGNLTTPEDRNWLIRHKRHLMISWESRIHAYRPGFVWFSTVQNPDVW